MWYLTFKLLQTELQKQKIPLKTEVTCNCHSNLKQELSIHNSTQYSQKELHKETSINTFPRLTKLRRIGQQNDRGENKSPGIEITCPMAHNSVRWRTRHFNVEHIKSKKTVKNLGPPKAKRVNNPPLAPNSTDSILTVVCSHPLCYFREWTFRLPSEG